MASESETVRAEFEAWAHDNGLLTARHAQRYTDGETQWAWIGYQAGRTPSAEAKDVEWAVMDDGLSLDLADRSDNQLSIVFGIDGVAYFAGYTPDARTHGRVYIDERVNPDFVQAMRNYAIAQQPKADAGEAQP